ncbi:HAD family hydrolase [Sphingomonas parva]|uniref:HAD family hydrolase n=1 Tax=Sphingomonas parva TaxID=2555898 RepID=A0A4Y8ZPM4_9SPHN|nr:HAD family hydrolase [Sphingomonas parva]TFI57961.1 HAD family hydrolase [Sphingomonas parva]
MFDADPSRRPAPRAALFDVDGTLVDTNDLHAVAWAEALRHFGHDFPVETIREQIGKGGDNLIPTLLGDIPEAEREALEGFRGTLFKRDYLPRAAPFPGVRPLFERLAADGVRILLASSSNQDEVAFHLALIGCEDLVFATTSRDDAAHSKPCPDIFEAALDRAGVAAEEAIVIGDSPWDVLAARRAGLAVIGFRSGGFSDDALLDGGAIALFDGPRDLLARYAASPFARFHAEA